MIADLWETIKKSSKKYKENDAYLAYDVNANEVSVWKEGYDEICYYRVNLNQLIDLGFDYDVLANLVFLNFMNSKDLYEKADH